MSCSSQQNQKYYEETERYVREYKGKTVGFFLLKGELNPLLK